MHGRELSEALLRIYIFETELKLLVVIDCPVDCPFGFEKNDRLVVSVQNEENGCNYQP